MTLLLDVLPMNVLHLIFEYLWATQIFYSFRNVSLHFNRAIDRYNSYHLDFRDLRKKSYDYILKHLKTQIKCLVISNEHSIPEFARVYNFLALNELSEFTQLEKLSLVDIDEEYYLEILSNISKFLSLKSLKLDRIPSYTGSRFTRVLPRLRRLDLPDASFFDQRSGQLFKNLLCLSVNRCTFERFEHLFNILPKTLRCFALKEGIISTVGNNAWPQFPRVLDQLRRINLQIDDCSVESVTIDQLHGLLSQMPHLTHINIKAEGDTDLVDGQKWKRFLVETYGNQLMKFDFCFTIWSYMEMNVNEVLASFSGPFWLDRPKPWYIAYNDRGLVYTIPHYALTMIRAETDLTCATTAKNNEVFYDSITQLMIFEQTYVPKHRFEKVTFLRVAFEAYHATFKEITAIVDVTPVQHMEILISIPYGLLDSMPYLYRLSLLNIKSLLLSLHKVGWKQKFKQIRILDISYNSDDHCLCDVPPESLCPMFPKITRLTMEGVNTRRAYIYRLLDKFSKLIYAKFQVDWNREDRENAKKDFETNTGRLISYEDRTNFSLRFETHFVHISIWDA